MPVSRLKVNQDVIKSLSLSASLPPPSPPLQIRFGEDSIYQLPPKSKLFENPTEQTSFAHEARYRSRGGNTGLKQRHLGEKKRKKKWIFLMRLLQATISCCSWKKDTVKGSWGAEESRCKEGVRRQLFHNKAVEMSVRFKEWKPPPHTHTMHRRITQMTNRSVEAHSICRITHTDWTAACRMMVRTN